MSGEEARNIVEEAVRRELFGPLGRGERLGEPLDISKGTVKFKSREDSYGRFHDAETGEEILTTSTPLDRYGIGVLHGQPDTRQRTDVEPQDVIEPEDPTHTSDQETLTLAVDAPEIEASENLAQKYLADRDDYADDFDLADAHKFKPSAMAISLKCRVPETASLQVRVQGSYYDPFEVDIFGHSKPRKWWMRRPFELIGAISANVIRLGPRTKKRVKDISERLVAPKPRSFELPLIEVYCRPAPTNAETSRVRGGLSKIRVHDLAQELDLDEQDTLARCLELGIAANTRNSRIDNSDADRVRRNFGSHLVTIVVTNQNPKPDSGSALFQMGFTVHARDGAAIDPYPEVQLPSSDEEQQSIDLLYRNMRTYAIGHGCAADWQRSAVGDPITWVAAVALPAHEVATPSPDLHVTDHDGNRKRLTASMEALANGSAEGNEQVETILLQYEKWIEDRDQEIFELPEKFQEAATRHMQDCRHALSRMRNGWDLARDTGTVANFAFRRANLAMLRQQVRSGFETRKAKRQVNGIWHPEGPHPPFRVPPGRGQWRPFQIAFILATLPELVYREDEHRSLVDLIFFPTGGGKTEAYLGACAVSLLARRRRNPSDSGTDTIMRYTLRLLTAQQFQRAAALICALEDIRSEDPKKLGKSPFGIGLWVGKANTPNTWSEACYELKKLKGDARAGNKFVLLRCPWCAAQMGPLGATSRDGPGQEVIGYETDGDRVLFRCADRECRFGGRETLPVHVVDEDTYETRPSIVIGTVDKFANLAWKLEARSLFGLGAQGGRDVSPPSLIVQDEMHAISGPLGSIFGIYEPVVEELCTDRRRSPAIPPKIIAATATVRRYREQVRGLFGRDRVALFPPHGLEEGQSFFASSAAADDEAASPRKRYLGIMSASLRSTQELQVRLAATTLQAAVEIPPADRDGYWTNLNFFNSLRHLGNTRSLLEFDVGNYLRGMRDRDNVDPRWPRRIRELTSRLRSDKIPLAIKELEEKYAVDAGSDQLACLDICLASNIIELGVDVDRLGLMTIAGQPKTISQYIQVSGRVGRRGDVPGLVLTIYRAANPRDRSHYERFRTDHQALYSQVEPTSVTPFAAPVLRRALHAVAISYVRQTAPDKLPDPFPEAEFSQAISLLSARAEVVDSEELPRLDHWAKLRAMEWTGAAPYREWKPKKDDRGHVLPGLMRFPKEFPALREKAVLWDVPGSMRNVDAECRLEIRSSGQGWLNKRRESDDQKHQIVGSVRQAHLITPWGSGAMSNMVDGTSLITAGLDHWYEVKDKDTVEPEEYTVNDPRLESRLGVSHFRLPPDYRTSLSKDEDEMNVGLTVPALRFPRWHYCVYCKGLKRARLLDAYSVKCDDETHAMAKTKPSMFQVQWVVMCSLGHLDDFSFREWVHRDAAPDCKGDLRLFSRGGGSPDRQIVKCDGCESERSLANITKAGADLASDGQQSTYLTDELTDAADEPYCCTGARPWLNQPGGRPGKGCQQSIRAAQRSASHVYFPLVESSILLPPEEGVAGKPLQDLCRSADVRPLMRVGHRKFVDAASVADFVKEFREELRIGVPERGDEIGKVADSEWIEAFRERLWEGDGAATPTYRTAAEGLTPTDVWRYPEYRSIRDRPQSDELSAAPQDVDGELADSVSRVLSVDDLTETRALRGFTRVRHGEPGISDGKDMLRRRSLPHDEDWLPAYVVRGEGIYLELEPSKLAGWEKQPEVVRRASAMRRNWRSAQQEPSSPRVLCEISPREVLVHTLGHLLINELVYTCGYSSASLRERLYVSDVDGREMAGLLIYTAAGDSDGTMGGLVRMARPDNLRAVFEAALSKARWCSTDPVCMEVGEKGQGPESCNLAACHGCALVPETSCEEFNRFLDRGLVVGTLEDPGLGYFSKFLDAVR